VHYRATATAKRERDQSLKLTHMGRYPGGWGQASQFSPSPFGWGMWGSHAALAVFVGKSGLTPRLWLGGGGVPAMAGRRSHAVTTPSPKALPQGEGENASKAPTLPG
jgi:hypothetical protein